LIQQVPAFVGETEVRAFLAALERECSAYCLLGGYEDLPATVRSDIDFMVGRQDFERLPHILRSLAQAIGFHLVQEMRHETTARYYCLAQSRPGAVLFLPPDSCSDYRRHSKTWLRPEAVLARRRRHPNGFWIPAAADDFLYYLIKRIEKQSFGKQSLEARHAQQLSRLFSADEQGCTEVLTRRLSTSSAQLVVAAARSGDWQPAIQAIHKLDEEFLASAPADSMRTKLGELRRRIRRWLLPTGLYIAVLGPDSSMRSSLIGQYAPAFARAFRHIEYSHLRPGLLRRSVAEQVIGAGPNGQPSRGVLASTARLLLQWADSVLGYYLRVRPLLVRSTLVVFDGGAQEMLGDARRPPYGGPPWLARLIAALTPMPDLIFVLDTPADPLKSQMQDVSAEEFARQTPDYRSVVHSAALRGGTVLVDATQPLEHVVHQCAEQTLALLERRTAKRLHLD
jgi:hypothetical protein